MIVSINGIPTRVVVDFYAPPRPMRITGSGFGDADPPEPEEIEWHLEDPRRPGKPCAWREAILSEWDRREIECALTAQLKKRSKND